MSLSGQIVRSRSFFEEVIRRYTHSANEAEQFADLSCHLQRRFEHHTWDLTSLERRSRVEKCRSALPLVSPQADSWSRILRP